MDELMERFVHNINRDKKVENFTADQITGLGLTGSSCSSGKIDEPLPAGCMCTTGDNNKVSVWARTGVIYGCK